MRTQKDVSCRLSWWFLSSFSVGLTGERKMQRRYCRSLEFLKVRMLYLRINKLKTSYFSIVCPINIIALSKFTVDGCSGITFEQKSSQWTLRSSAVPKSSKKGETSYLLSCLLSTGIH